jgi:hypothetical protein
VRHPAADPLSATTDASGRLLSSLAAVVDRVVEWLKWPTAVAAALLLPPALSAAWLLVRRIVHEPTPIVAFALGLALYLIVWQLVLRQRIFGSFFSVLEHELTHALFALATLHPVTGLRATFYAGGHVRWRGRGNWLIYLSPYFFPTVCVAIIAAAALVPDAWRWWADALLGAATAYHLTSTMQETHGGQTDLAHVGFVFSLLVLPTANVVALGTVVAFCHDGLGGLQQFVGDVGGGMAIYLRLVPDAAMHAAQR